MKRDTVGKISTDLLNDETPLDHSAFEQMQESLSDYEKNLVEAVESGKKTFFGDFYIVVETKKEPKMQNVIRNYFFSRQTCPTPIYDEAVYRYNAKDEAIEFLWV